MRYQCIVLAIFDIPTNLWGKSYQNWDSVFYGMRAEQNVQVQSNSLFKFYQSRCFPCFQTIHCLRNSCMRPYWPGETLFTSIEFKEIMVRAVCFQVGKSRKWSRAVKKTTQDATIHFTQNLWCGYIILAEPPGSSSCAGKYNCIQCIQQR